MACGTTWGTPPAGTAATALLRLEQRHAPRRPTAAKGSPKRHVVSLILHVPDRGTTSRPVPPAHTTERPF